VRPISAKGNALVPRPISAKGNALDYRRSQASKAPKVRPISAKGNALVPHPISAKGNALVPHDIPPNGIAGAIRVAGCNGNGETG